MLQKAFVLNNIEGPGGMAKAKKGWKGWKFGELNEWFLHYVEVLLICCVFD